MAFNWRKFPWTNLHDLNLDWIIQTVKTLADAVSTFPEMINKAITNTLTGNGDLTINKTGDVRISGTGVTISGGGTHISGSGDFTVNKAGAVRLSGNNVYLSDTFISGGSSEILTLHNSNSSTNVSFGYNSGVLSLSNNQDLAAGVALHPIRTPEIVDGDDSDFAANVGYVKDAVNTVDSKLDTEISNRTAGDAAIQTALSTETENRKSGDAAIQTAIEHEIKPKLVRDFHVTGTDDQNGYITAVTFKDGYPKSDLDNLIAQNAEIRLVVETAGSSLYFNICRPWGNNYIGFSGIVQLAYGAASQVIGYNGTNFTVYGNNAT